MTLRHPVSSPAWGEKTLREHIIIAGPLLLRLLSKLCEVSKELLTLCRRPPAFLLPVVRDAFLLCELRARGIPISKNFFKHLPHKDLRKEKISLRISPLNPQTDHNGRQITPLSRATPYQKTLNKKPTISAPTDHYGHPHVANFGFARKIRTAASTAFPIPPPRTTHSR